MILKRLSQKFFRLTIPYLVVLFMVTGRVEAQLPQIIPTSVFHPALLKGILIDPQNPLKFNFIIDTGETKFSDEAFKAEADKFIKYF